MTSKEALDKLRKHNGFIPLGEELDLFDIIEKDLEVLELLKNIIKVEENKKYTSSPKYFIKIREDVVLNDGAKEILKEWLREKERR